MSDAQGCTVLVCGGRGYTDAPALTALLDDFHAHHLIKFLVHGNAKGADLMAYAWAKSRGIPGVAVVANWELHGKKAGPIRNQKMLDRYRPDYVIAFPGGSGTADMTRRAAKVGVPVVDAP